MTQSVKKDQEINPDKFIRQCIEKLEQVHTNELANTLNTFLQR